jgi:hypothetical protein
VGVVGVAPAAGAAAPGKAGAGAAEGAVEAAASPHWTADAASVAHVHDRRPADDRPGRAGFVFGVLFVVFGTIALVGPIFPGWAGGANIGAAFVLALGVALLAGAARRPVSGT